MASLTIKVHQPRSPGKATTSTASASTHFHPGSSVSGVLTLHTPAPIRISSVRIVLRGRAKVKIRSSEHYTTRSFRSRALFFPPLTQTLFDSAKVVGANAGTVEDLATASKSKDEDTATSSPIGSHFSHKAGDYLWPFEVRLPKQCDVHSIVNMASNPYRADNTPDSAAFATTRPKWHLDHMGMMQRVDRPTATEGVESTDGTRQLWENDFFAPQRPWRGSRDPREHGLPHSFEYVSSRWPLDWEARVEYVLLATVSRPGGTVLFPVKDLTATYELPVRAFEPGNISSLLKQKRATKFSGTFLSRALEPVTSNDKITSPTEAPTQVRRLSLLDRTQSKFRPAAFSKTSFDLCLETPRYVYPGSAIPLSTVRMEPSSNAPENPPARLNLRLKALTLSLLTTTAVRDNATTTLEQRAQRTDSETLFKKKDMNTDLPTLGSDLDIDLPPLPTNLTPSFTTYNIARWHRLAVDLKVQVPSGETVSMTHDGIDITVLPVPDAAARGPDGPAATPVVPSYEEATTTVGSSTRDGHDDVEDKKGPDGPPPPRRAAREEEQLPAYEP